MGAHCQFRAARRWGRSERQLTRTLFMPIIQSAMATAAQQARKNPKVPAHLAAQRAAELADVLQAFAETLRSLDASMTPGRKPGIRNWWRTQAGRFKDHPTFSEFVRQVQDARKRDE